MSKYRILVVPGDVGPSIEVGLREGLLTTKAPSSLTMVSWNIDGLDDKNLQKRTKAVCK